MEIYGCSPCLKKSKLRNLLLEGGGGLLKEEEKKGGIHTICTIAFILIRDFFFADDENDHNEDDKDNEDNCKDILTKQ